MKVIDDSDVVDKRKLIAGHFHQHQRELLHKEYDKLIKEDQEREEKEERKEENFN
jgi:carbonic anhydrase/acetyltransferase-like protein (isoleucine patch superfamily)